MSDDFLIKQRYYPAAQFFHGDPPAFSDDSIYNPALLIECIEHGETIDGEWIDKIFYRQWYFWKGATLLYMSQPQTRPPFEKITEAFKQHGYIHQSLTLQSWRWELPIAEGVSVTETFKDIVYREMLMATSQLCKYIAEQANDGKDYYNLVGADDALSSLLAHFEMRVTLKDNGFQVLHKGVPLQNLDGSPFECELRWGAIARAVESMDCVLDE
jgi:hypothetical protein